MTLHKQHEHAFAMDADGQTVVVDREGAKMLTLNAAGGLLWERAAAPVSVDDLTETLAAAWPEIDRAQLRADAEAFVVEAASAGILVPVEGAS